MNEPKTNEAQVPDPDGPLMLGPLTGDEWASLFLVNGGDGEDERNPLPACCGNIAAVRDALADVLRVGGSPDLGWLRIAPVWEDIYYCLDKEQVMAHPVMRKLYDAYVAGREIPSGPNEAYEWFRALTLDQARQYLATLDGPDSLFDLESASGRMRALTRMAGAFVAFVVDDKDRQVAAFELADKLAMNRATVCLIVDVMRQNNDLPYRPTQQHRVADGYGDAQ